MGSEFGAAVILTDADSKPLYKLEGIPSTGHHEETLHEDRSSRRDIVAVVFFVLFIGLVGLVASLVVAMAASSGGGDNTGSEPFSTESDQDSGPAGPADIPLEIATEVREEKPTLPTWWDIHPSSRTGLSTVSSPHTPAPRTQRPTIATEPVTTTTTTVATTTTSKEPRIRELVCTVGHSAVAASMYPADRYCDYLYYCDVIIMGGRLMGVEEQTSWEQFQEQAKTYKHVKLGVAFDFRYITASKLDTARNSLNMLAQVKNINHYGVLNIIGRQWHLRQAVNDMGPVFEKLKEFQGNDPSRRTIIAIASYSYTYFDIELYKKMIATAVNDFKVDTVIAVSSTGSMEDDLTCIAAPPSALEDTNVRFPSLELHSMFVSARFQYRNSLAMVGLSFELGALVYMLKKDAPNFRSIAYAPCVTSGITSQDAICGQNPKAFDSSRQSLGKSIEAVGAFLNATTRREVVISEFRHTVVSKFTKAERRFGPFRNKLSWLLFNVHLGDHMGRCGTGPFYILEKFCEVFKGPC